MTHPPKPAPIADEALVERLALAIFAAEPDDGYDWSELDAEIARYPDETTAAFNTQERARRRARAALAALPPHTGSGDGEVEKLREVERAARSYFMGYVQDEADDREYCVSDEQHEDAKALRAALNGGDHD